MAGPSHGPGSGAAGSGSAQAPRQQAKRRRVMAVSNMPAILSQKGGVCLNYATGLSPGRCRTEVFMYPSFTLKIPGNLDSHALLAAGTYWRALASMAATVGTCAARPAEWIREAPGQVRSCTQRNILNFWAAAAISSAWVCCLQAFSAAPV